MHGVPGPPIPAGKYVLWGYTWDVGGRLGEKMRGSFPVRITGGTLEFCEERYATAQKYKKWAGLVILPEGTTIPGKSRLSYLLATGTRLK